MQISLPDKSRTPFSDEQYRIFGQFLGSVSREQLAWIGGYLTAMTSVGGASGLSTSPTGASDITILVGSQTGNGEALAEQLHQLAGSRGLRTVVKKLGDYKLPQLKAEKNLLVIVSTHGEGDPPDNTKEMHEFLFSKRAPALKDLHFAVLGLGDSSYEFFCKMGVDFDKRLAELGATRIHPRVDCDVDYESVADKWMNDVLTELATRVEKVSTPGIEVASSMAMPSASAYSRKNPFPSVLLEDIVLNGRGSQKETHHIEISLEGSGLTYEPGDALGVYPTNAPDVVDELLVALNYAGGESVTIDGRETSVYDAFFRNLEITTITRPTMQKYAAIAQNAQLDELLSESHKKELNTYLDGREIIDLVSDFPVKGMAPQIFVDLLRKIPPRLYSIASSLKQHPDEVHLTAVAVRYLAHNRDRKGVCTTFFADRVGEYTRIPVYVDHNNNFKLPSDPSRPIIMVGPGTGVAPFRAFVEERDAISASGKNWLFFGDQHFTTDFLYQAEWLKYLKQGVLTRLNVAFSRDQADKIYVQHRMLENSRDIYAWLQEGAHFYVCGDEKRMAHDVHAALIQIVEKEGNMDRERADEFVKQLQKEKRYQRDVY